MPSSPHAHLELYLALYDRSSLPLSLYSSPARYHWALLLSPSSDDRAIRIHAINHFPPSSSTSTHWLYEEIHIPAHSTAKLLSKTLVGTVVERNEERLLEVLRDVPVLQSEGWSCVDWMEGAVEAVQDGQVLMNGDDGSGKLGWERLMLFALRDADAEKGRKEGLIRAVL